MGKHQTIIIGNGLGMAIDPDFYSLENRIKKVWEKAWPTDDDIPMGDPRRDRCHFYETDKASLRPFIPQGHETFTGEDDMDALHRVSVACEEINDVSKSIPSGLPDWLSQEAQALPFAAQRFKHSIGSAFIQDGPDCVVWTTFLDCLMSHITPDKSISIATLNYDSLLYNLAINKQLDDGFGGTTRYSVNRNRFANAKNQYMHLHGSALFHGIGIKHPDCPILKSERHSQNSTPRRSPVGSHIVLTHIKHKRAVIAASELLTMYWEQLAIALSKPNADLILFGYSGLDTHLNELIANHHTGKIRVVEWDGSGGSNETNVTRQDFWNDNLLPDDRSNTADRITVIRMENILKFYEWNPLDP